MPDSTLTLRQTLVRIAKVAIVLVVLFAVGHSFRDAWGQLGRHDWSLEPAWLLLSGFIYLGALVPMALFWGQLLAGLPHPPTLLNVFRGYYLGHLAKYVPGKALTLVVRVAAVRSEGAATAPVVATVFIETLSLMAVGAGLSAWLISSILPEQSSYPLLTALFALAAMLPAVPPVTKRILGWILRREIEATDRLQPMVLVYSWRLFTAGCVAALVSWFLMGLSIWATVRAVGIHDADPLREMNLWILAAAMPVVAGFFSMIPGGLIVRDGLMILLLGPRMGEPMALVITLLIRLTWLVAEFLACGILEVAARNRRTREPREN